MNRPRDHYDDVEDSAHALLILAVLASLIFLGWTYAQHEQEAAWSELETAQDETPHY